MAFAPYILMIIPVEPQSLALFSIKPDVQRSLGGGSNVIENNVFIECDPSIQVDARGLSWSKRYFDQSDPRYMSTLYDRMDAVNFSQPPYSKHYPKLLTLYDDEPAVPKHNKIIRNVSFGGRFIDLYDNLDFATVRVSDNVIADSVILRHSQASDQSESFQTYEYGHAPTMARMKGNIFVKGNPEIQPARDMYLRLKRNLPIREIGFKEIPVETIGLYKDKYRSELEK